MLYLFCKETSASNKTTGYMSAKSLPFSFIAPFSSYPHLRCLSGMYLNDGRILVSNFVEIILGDTGFNLSRFLAAFFVSINRNSLS